MNKPEIHIRIKICDRTYPMRIAADDEYVLRHASKEVNDSVNRYMNKFNITDKQDLLAMVAFDCVVSRLQNEKIDVDAINKKIDLILEELEN